VVPITAVTVVLDERVVVMVIIIPAGLVMVIGLGSAGAGGDKKNSEDGLEEVFLNEFHFVKNSAKALPRNNHMESQKESGTERRPVENIPNIRHSRLRLRMFPRGRRETVSRFSRRPG
jgi:hypothetical protein